MHAGWKMPELPKLFLKWYRVFIYGYLFYIFYVRPTIPLSYGCRKFDETNHHDHDLLVVFLSAHSMCGIVCLFVLSAPEICPVRSESSLCAQWVAKDPNFLQRRLWSDWADAQAELSLRWAYRSLCCFCRAAAKFMTVALPGLFFNNLAIREVV